MKRLFLFVLSVMCMFTFSVSVNAAQSKSKTPKTKSVAKQVAQPLVLKQTITMPTSKGKIDHLFADTKNNRLFVATKGNDDVTVIDLKAGKQVSTITGLQEPQGIAYIPELNKIYITNGKSGELTIHDGTSYKQISAVKFGDDADDIRYDEQNKLLYLSYSGSLGIYDPVNNKRLNDIKFDSHPEGFGLEEKTSKMYTNLSDTNNIGIVDRKTNKKIATWDIKGITKNVPLALDEKNHRVFVDCRKPATFVVFDTKTGKEVFRMASSGDTDDMFFDAAEKLIFVICGEGFIDVIKQDSPDKYTLVTKIPTGFKARTATFVPEKKILYLAVPEKDGKPAEVRVYSVNKSK